MRFDVVTVFPGMFAPVFETGVVGRAIAAGRIELHAHDLRDFTADRHRQVDDMPYGGGPGMVMMPGPLFAAVDRIRPVNPGPVVLLEPWGRRLDQALVRELAGQPGLIVLCGRYEGIDDRVRDGLGALEISIGDYVVSGGELPAMVLIDAVSRLVPGVLGDPDSLTIDSFAEGNDGELGHPQYTRPPEFRGLRVPDVLLSGNHQQIQAWRRQRGRERSQQREAARGPISTAGPETNPNTATRR